MGACADGVDEVGDDGTMGNELGGFFGNEGPFFAASGWIGKGGLDRLGIVHVIAADMIAFVIGLGPGIFAVLVMLQFKANLQEIRMAKAGIIKSRGRSDQFAGV